MHAHISRLAATAAATLSSGLLVPLYIYPTGDTSCSNWTPLISSIAAHPSVPFYVIINPNSGPGSGSQPDAEYQKCTPQILNHTNVIGLGYIPTGYGAASSSDFVTTSIDTYSGWDASYRPSGIFFDEASGQTADLGTYQTYSDHAKSLFSFVTLNPGINPADDSYYNIADLILTAEDFYSDFSTSQLELGSATPASKQAVMLHDAPSTPPTDLISELITGDRIAAFYVTDDTQANNGNPYDSLPTDLESFVAAVESAASA